MSPRLLVFSNDHVSTRMAGPAIRAYELARWLAPDFEVTLAAPFATDLDAVGFEIAQVDSGDHAQVTDLSARFDAVLAQWLPPETMVSLARTGIRAVYDLYDPAPIEQLAVSAATPGFEQERNARLIALRLRVALTAGDAFVCATERQRDLWLGYLAAVGRLDQEHYLRDTKLRSLIDVVPFGIDPDPPQQGPPVLKGVVPGIGKEDRVLIWGGGIWDWLDPQTVIFAVAELASRRDDVRLYFMGLARPNPFVPRMEMSRRAVDLSEKLGLLGRVVFFNETWCPYRDRGAYLMEADLGVLAHFDNVESRFAWRTRLLDCLWAGLPVVTTRGDVLSDLIAAKGCGRAVGAESVEAWVRALAELLDRRRIYRSARKNISQLRKQFEWPRVVRPLRALLSVPGQPLRDTELLDRALEQYLAATAEGG